MPVLIVLIFTQKNISNYNVYKLSVMKIIYNLVSWIRNDFLWLFLGWHLIQISLRTNKQLWLVTYRWRNVYRFNGLFTIWFEIQVRKIITKLSNKFLKITIIILLRLLLFARVIADWWGQSASGYLIVFQVGENRNNAGLKS